MTAKIQICVYKHDHNLFNNINFAGRFTRIEVVNE